MAACYRMPVLSLVWRYRLRPVTLSDRMINLRFLSTTFYPQGVHELGPEFGASQRNTCGYPQACPQVVNKRLRRCPQGYPQMCAQVGLCRWSAIPNVVAGHPDRGELQKCRSPRVQLGP
jgi:hypothetical protein